MKKIVLRIAIAVIEIVIAMTVILLLKGNSTSREPIVWEYPNYELVTSGKLQPYQDAEFGVAEMLKFKETYPKVEIVVRTEERREGFSLLDTEALATVEGASFKCKIFQHENLIITYFSQIESVEKTKS